MAGGLLPDVCADCDALHPQWASVNYGVLLCDDCASLHRHLGRHVSQVKHITRSKWRATQLAMVRQLASSGANRFWEHLLLAPPRSSKKSRDHSDVHSRKPLPTDPVHPNKTEFIREKYLFMAFFKRPAQLVAEDVNQQLHASVRTNVLESSLYLLALGGDPNFVHPIRGTTPLHVACQNNQPAQAELLLTYGADLNVRDSQNNTPLDMALQCSHQSLGGVPVHPDHLYTSMGHPSWTALLTALLEARYELTDLLSHFLCHQTPQHGLSDSHHHFLIPRLPHEQLDHSIAVQEAKRKLQFLPNSAFKDLCVDVHDEIERRETNSVILPHHPQIHSPITGGRDPANLSSPLCLPFLPPNRAYSSTRNQGRQKLARLDHIELTTLTMDLLIEAKERLVAIEMDPTGTKMTSSSAQRLSSLISVHRQSGAIPIPVPRIAKPGTMNMSGGGTGSSRGSHRNSCGPDLGMSCSPDVSQRNSVMGCISVPIPGHEQNRNEDEVYDYVAGDSEYASVAELGLNFLQSTHDTSEESRPVTTVANNGEPASIGVDTTTPDVRTIMGSIKRGVSISSDDLTTPATGTETSADDSNTALETAANIEADKRLITQLKEENSVVNERCVELARELEEERRHAAEDRSTIEELTKRLDQLEQQNRGLDDRNRQLEEMTCRLEKQMERVGEEKDALMAAMSAGMVMSHPPSLSDTTKSGSPTNQTPRQTSAHQIATNNGQKSGSPCHDANFHSSSTKSSSAAGMSRAKSAHLTGTANYSTGFAAGLGTSAEVRQEVFRSTGGTNSVTSPSSAQSPAFPGSHQQQGRGAPSLAGGGPPGSAFHHHHHQHSSHITRGDSPLVGGGRGSPHIQMYQPQAALSMSMSSAAVTSISVDNQTYVNVNTLSMHQQQNRGRVQSDHNLMASHQNQNQSRFPHDIMDVSGNISMPHSGSPHSHRHPVSHHRETDLGDDGDGPGDDYSNPSGVGTPVDPLMQSSTTTPGAELVHEYDSAMEWSGQQQTGGKAGGARSAGVEEWPSSHRVVKSVETVVKLIRTLLELANAGLRGHPGTPTPTAELLSCASQIQLSVQALVHLFPIHQLRSRPHILTPLHNIVSGADQLRRDCQRHGEAVDSALAANTGLPNSTPVIQRAQEIAIAARQLLQRCQKPGDGERGQSSSTGAPTAVSVEIK